MVLFVVHLAELSLPVLAQLRHKRLESLSCNKRGSAHRKKALARLGAVHARIAAMRRDFRHQYTTQRVREQARIVIKELSVKSMSASAAGTLDAPWAQRQGQVRAEPRHCA